MISDATLMIAYWSVSLAVAFLTARTLISIDALLRVPISQEETQRALALAIAKHARNEIELDYLAGQIEELGGIPLWINSQAPSSTASHSVWSRLRSLLRPTSPARNSTTPLQCAGPTSSPSTMHAPTVTSASQHSSSLIFGGPSSLSTRTLPACLLPQPGGPAPGMV